MVHGQGVRVAHWHYAHGHCIPDRSGNHVDTSLSPGWPPWKQWKKTRLLFRRGNASSNVSAFSSDQKDELAKTSSSLQPFEFFHVSHLSPCSRPSMPRLATAGGRWCLPRPRCPEDGRVRWLASGRAVEAWAGWHFGSCILAAMGLVSSFFTARQTRQYLQAPSR